MLTGGGGRRDQKVLPPTNSSSRVLVADAVAKRYRIGSEVVVALEDASIAVAAGEFVCLMGASGSGKSTLLAVLAGIEPADTGTVSVLGVDLGGYSERARAAQRLDHIGVVFQSHNLVPELTAQENVALPLMARGFPQREVRKRATDALAIVGIGDLAGRFPAVLSGGQRQRVGIARALAGSQELLLADEPTGALDAGNATSLYTMLQRLCSETGLAVVLATHDERAVRFADRQVHIVAGVTSS